MAEKQGGHQSAPQENQKLWDVRKIKLTNAIKSLGNLYGPLSNVTQDYSIPDDPNSDLVVKLRFGGAYVILSCSLNGDPMYQFFDRKKNQYTNPQPIETVDGASFKYENLMKEVQERIDQILFGEK